MANKYLNMLGLAYRARKLSMGEDVILKDIQAKRAKLVLIANDIGTRTKKKLIDKCNSYDVPFNIVDDRMTLGNAVGKPARVAVAILDEGFAKKLQSLLL